MLNASLRDRTGPPLLLALPPQQSLHDLRARPRGFGCSYFLAQPLKLVFPVWTEPVSPLPSRCSGRFMTFVLGITAFAYVGLYPLFYR